MNLQKKISEWVSKGIISKAQGDQIEEYEKSISGTGVWVYAILTLGVTIISLGVISFIAANWEEIPPNIKLISDFIILILVGYFLYKKHTTGEIIFKDRLIVLFQILILASIGLISQIYHTSGELYEALFLWTFITIPIVLHAENKFPSHFLIVSVLFSIFNFINLRLNLNWQDVIFIYFLVMPSFLIGLGFILQSTILNSLNRFGKSLHFWGVFLVMLGTINVHFIDDYKYSKNYYYIIIISYFSLVVLVAYYINKIKKISLIIATIAAMVYFLSFYFHSRGMDSKIWDALLFIFFWLFFGSYFLTIQFQRLFEFSIVVVGLRFVIVYFQIIDSLLLMAFGFIISGGVIVGLVLVYLKYRESIYKSLEKYV